MKLFLTLFFISLFSIANGQTQFKFNHFTTDDGLPCNTIYGITEDKFGNIVLGTDNGLSIFDGTEFTNYNVKDGLLNPYIVGVTNDEKGNVWLVNYNSKLQKFVNNKIIITNIDCVFFNNLIHFQNKLFLYNSQIRLKNNAYAFKEFPPGKVTNGTIATSKIAPPILILNQKKINIIANKICFENYQILAPASVTLIHKIIFRKNDVCVLDDDFLFIINFSGVILNQIKLPSNLSKNAIYKNDFIVDKQGNCWLNIQNTGLFVLEDHTWKSVNNQINLTAKENINFLYCDKKGKIWIATHDNGLFCISTTLVKTIFSENENYYTGLETSFDRKSMLVSSPFILYEYKNKNLNFVDKYDSEVKLSSYNLYPVLSNSKYKKFEFNKQKNCYNINAKQILKIENNTYFSSGLYGGLSVFKNGIRKSIQTNPTEKERIKNVDKYKNNYYFNNSTNISIRNFDTINFNIKRNLNLNIKGFINDFKFVKDTMYIATDDKVYKAINENIVDSISSINNYQVNNIRKIKVIDNQIFLCGNNGLIMISKHKNRIINKYNFLNDNEVFDVAKLENELFVATKKGVSKIDFSLIENPSEKLIFKIFYNNHEVQKLDISSQQELLKLALKIQNFNAAKNQIIQYKIDASGWNVSQTKNIYFQSLSYGNHKVSIRVKDVNSGWETKKILVHKEYPFYLKWWFLLSSFLAVFSLVYFVYQHQIKKNKVALEQKNNINNKIVELRQNALSAMMNPHFIFNSLNAIQYFVNSNQKEQSSEHLGKLARLVRLFLSQAAEPFISISDEINRLKLYVELEQTRFENFDFNVNVNSNIDAKNIKIPNMIVQPFIENAILHGVSHFKTNDGKINLNFNLENNTLTIEIIDNGFGIDENKLKNDIHISKGIGIITERIEILQETYPEKIFSIVQESAFSDSIRKGHKVIIIVSIL